MPQDPLQVMDRDEYEMPATEALLGAAMALMTGHAQSTDRQAQQFMARKVAQHLAVLARREGLTLGLRQLIDRLQTHWCVLAGAMPVCQDPSVRGAAPGMLCSSAGVTLH